MKAGLLPFRQVLGYLVIFITIWVPKQAFGVLQNWIPLILGIAGFKMIALKFIAMTFAVRTMHGQSDA